MKIEKGNVRTAEAAVAAAPLDPAGDTPAATTPNGAAIRLYRWIAILIPIIISSCAAPDTQHHVVISTREQKLALLDRGKVMAIYPVSTSKFGLGDWRGSRFTPLGQLQIAEKIGGSAPPGAVFKDRRRTGEIIQANAPGRDPIVTRILWLRGVEAQNANAFGRDIYTHGSLPRCSLGVLRESKSMSASTIIRTSS